MRYELIDGDTKLISRLANDGWLLINTFPNPYPQPYFFALMKYENTKEAEKSYDLKKVKEEIERERINQNDYISF